MACCYEVRDYFPEVALDLVSSHQASSSSVSGTYEITHRPPRSHARLCSEALAQFLCGNDRLEGGESVVPRTSLSSLSPLRRAFGRPLLVGPLWYRPTSGEAWSRSR